ncbi:MAG: insulinase family protein [Bacteroidota bacterium]
MKKTKQLFIWIAFILVSASAVAQKQYKYETVAGDPLNARIYTLDNGLKVFMTVYKDAPRIQTFIGVKVGSKNDPAETTGLAHYFEHMMFKGTPNFGTSDWNKEKVLISKIDSLFEIYRVQKDLAKRAATYHLIDSISYAASKIAIPNEYDKLMKAIGSNGTNAATSNDYTMYVEDIPANQIENWAKIQADRFSSPVLRLFHTELETVYEEKNMSLTQDRRKASEAMLKALFPNHPYGKQTTLGETEHLKNPSMKNIREFFAKYYVPNNMAIIMSGDFDPDQTIKIIDENFGKLKSSTVPELKFAIETPITAPIEKDVLGLDAENLTIAYRFNGANSTDALMLEMISNLLNNDKAGLIDVNINQKQTMLGAGTGVYGLKDYSAFILAGTPKEGQTLEEAKKLLLDQIELLKKGQFEDWMLEATINNLVLQKVKEYETNRGRASAILDAFLNDIEWSKAVNTINDMKKITKADIVAFANKNFGSNYVVIYKRQGTPPDVTKVEKPKITPIFINREMESTFLKNIKNSKVPEIKPVFLDYTKDLKQLTAKNNIKIIYKDNSENKTFNLYYYFKMGQFNDPIAEIAMSYLPYLGTSKKTCEQINQEFYRLACDFSVNAGNEETWVTISGLSDKMEKAMSIVEELIADPQANKEALDNLVSDILKSRADAKLNQKANFTALVDYATFGPNSTQRYLLSETELKALKPEQLIAKIKEMMEFEHSILYYGPESPEKLTELVNKLHNVKGTLKTPPTAKVFTEQETNENKVYFAQYDAKQAYLQLLSKGGLYNASMTPSVSLYNAYFGGSMNSIVFQELREKRSLAYTARSTYQTPTYSTKPYMNSSFIATQNDKIFDAFNAYNDLFNNMPESEGTFNLAKDGIISNINTERITRMNIIWNYISAQRRGLSYDIRKDLYAKIPTMTVKDVKLFNEQFIKNKTKTYIILSKEADINFGELEKYGKVIKLTQSDIFGY